MITRIKNYLQSKIPEPPSTPVTAAYDAWSGSYDCQPGNLMLDLDNEIFTRLTGATNFENKKVADIGCGTGRHWRKIYALRPRLVMGFDVSAGMLQQLKNKFPDAIVHQVTDNRLQMVPRHFADIVISTLTIAHIKNIEEAIAAWAGILTPGGELFITDFHPCILAKGGKRSFSYRGHTVSVTNYVHPLQKVIAVFAANGLHVIKQEERKVDASVQSYYTAQNALHVYERFKNMPVIYGLHLKKHNAAD